MRTEPGYHAFVAVAGGVCALGVCVGALGPWLRTPVITFSGWAGIGFPLVVLAFVILAVQVLHAFVPRRAWLVLNLLLGALILVAAIVLALLESVLSHFGSLIAFLFARGAHRDLFGSGQPVSLAWGIPVLAVMAFFLMIVCIAGLFGRFGERWAVAPVSAEGPSQLAGPRDHGVRGLASRLRREARDELTGTGAAAALDRPPAPPVDDLL